MRAVPALIAIAAGIAASQLSGAGPAQAQCSVFRRRPCVPGPEYPYVEGLRLTILTPPSDQSTNAAEPQAGSGTAQANSEANSGGTHKLNTIRDLFADLRACWMPPPLDQSRPGMQMTVRLSFMRSGEMIAPPRVTYFSPGVPAETRKVYQDAITASLDRCTPLPFSGGLGGALAGIPISIRFVDNRDHK